MTVCGEKITGVCVAAKCPHFKRCCPVMWDKYGKIKPKTNEEWMKSLDTEGFAEAIFAFMDAVNHQNTGEHITNKDEIIRRVILRWLKEKHE